MNTKLATPQLRHRASAGQRLIACSSIAVAFALSVATTAHAQTAGTEDAASSGDNQIADIVVTARRTEERLQDIPGSVSAITGDAVARMGSLADVQSLVSGVTFQTVGPIPAVGIRGFGKKSLLEVRDKLIEHGLELKPPKGGFRSIDMLDDDDDDDF